MTAAFVHLKSDRTLDPVRQDSSFPEKQESQTALVLVVRCASERRDALGSCFSPSGSA
jgi:hypothetical protein